MFRLDRFVIISVAFFIIGSASLYGQANLPVELESAPSINTIASFGLNEGLPTNCLKNVVTDRQGRLWVSPCATTWLDDNYNFFQYDGKKAFQYEVSPDWIAEPTDTTINWFVWGETANGLLYGTSYNYQTVFSWHPDLREQYFFNLHQGEQLLNLISAPGGGILVLTLTETKYQVYRLVANKQQKIGEITLDFTEELFDFDNRYSNAHSFTLAGQKAWFFHQRSGLVTVDLLDETMQFHPWNKLSTQQTISEFAYDQGAGLTWQMLPSYGDQLLLYLGVNNGFFSLHETSLDMQPLPLLNQLSLPTNTPGSPKVVSFFQDQKNNILINIGYEYPFVNDKNKQPYGAYL